MTIDSCPTTRRGDASRHPGNSFRAVGLFLLLVGCASADQQTAEQVEVEITIPPGVLHTITGVQSGKCVQIEGASTSNLARAEITSCNGSTNQQFRMTPVANASGFFTVQNENSKKCLDVEGVSTADGARVIQWTCGTGQNQQWSFTDVSTGVVRLTARHSNKVLNVTGSSTNDGTDLNQMPWTNVTSQQFRVNAVGGSGGSGGGAGGSAGSGATSSGGTSTGGSGATSGGGTSTGGTGATGGACQSGTTTTAWASSCQSAPASCVAGTWRAPRDGGETGAPLMHESAHFAFYWPSGTNITLAQAQTAASTLEMIWSSYFGSPIFFPEPYCNSADKWKAAVHFDNSFPLWGGGWGRNGISYMGMWVGPGAAADQWGLGHEFMHGLQSTTQAFPDCGGVGCWIFESHANWMPHQIFRDNVHCSDMLPNMPHLYYGNTRNRYCNWQFFEFLKDKHCYKAVNDMWAYQAPSGQRDPWQKLMLSRGWNIEQLNDVFGEWAMHNVTWDYKNPPPTNGSVQGATYRQRYGSIEPNLTSSGRTDRRLRLTRLESLDASWAQNRRFVSPYHWAPQRWGYNVVRLHQQAGASSVRVTFRGVTQSGANTGFRWGLVATDSGLTTARYSPLQRGTDGVLDFCVGSTENVYLVVVATPTQYQKLVWTNPSDGPAYGSIYRYPYMVQIDGAWPAGFQNGQLEACPSGTVRHSNGNGCAPSGTPSSVFVGPYAKIVGGSVTGNTRVEDHATVVNGTVSGGRIGALSLVGQGGSGIQARGFNVSGSAVVQTSFYPLGWFGSGQSVSGTARLLGDVEFVSSNKSSNTFYGFVPNDWTGVASVTEVTVAPPYSWRP